VYKNSFKRDKIMDQRPFVGVAVLVIDRQHKKILIGERIGSTHGNDTWQTPGGRLEFKETPEQCAIRELEEETGLIASGAKNTVWVNTVFELNNGKQVHYITLFMIVDSFSGTLQNMEPEKCRGWDWVTIHQLLSLKDNLLPSLQGLIQEYDINMLLFEYIF
jgi:8-oxo-dGTP diphosphatase